MIYCVSIIIDNLMVIDGNNCVRDHKSIFYFNTIVLWRKTIRFFYKLQVMYVWCSAVGNVVVEYGISVY